MKLLLLKTGLLTCLLFLGWSYEQTFAATTVPPKCANYGNIVPGINPSGKMINCLLTNAAMKDNIPPEVVKAVAAKESGWKQFKDNGQPTTNLTGDGGIGIMQITNPPENEVEQLSDDIVFNIQAGVEILKQKYNRIYSTGSDRLPRIIGANQYVIENWYFPVMAYNGTVPINSPLHQADGTKNKDAYQEAVFRIIQNDSYLINPDQSPYPNIFARFPFSRADFTYNSGSPDPIIFNRLEYTVTDPMHASAYFFKKGDRIVVTQDVPLRSDATKNSKDVKDLTKNTTLIIDGDFTYDKTNENNRFVWYPVKTADQKVSGFVSTPYIRKMLKSPTVNPVNDRDKSISGKAPANAAIQVTAGTKTYKTVAGATGQFKVNILVQKAGARLTVTYKDSLNQLSLPTNITVHPYNGWFTQNGKRYHYTKGVVNTGWYKYGGYKYYLDPLHGGAMKIGWLIAGNNKYYFAGTGKMVTGWQKINGKWYYFYSNGKMAHDTKIGKYRLGHSGAVL